MVSNYDDVLSQLTSFGLQVERLEIGRLVKCKVEGDKEKRGWYTLHELALDNGGLLIVGSYGIWRGTDNNAQKVELRKTEISREQRDALRKRMAEDQKRAQRARQAEGARAAARAATAWAKCQAVGECDYLTRKGVRPHGVRFSPSGAMVIPMLDVTGRIHGLQIIRGKREKGRKLDKEFWPSGLIKKGHFHLIGMPGRLILVCEGYATAASVHEATGLPVVVAFDAGNLGPVCAALRKRYKLAKILICADDDAFSEANAGIASASAASLEVSGAFVAPVFADPVARKAAFDQRGTKLSDFNDLHLLEGLHVVRAQIEARLSELNWRAEPKRPPAGESPRGEGGSPLRPIDSLDELLERFAMVYGQGGTVFDRQEHTLLPLSDMRDACMSRETHRAWMEHPDRAIVRVEEVGFDPAGEDPTVTCNLWAGWPTVPRAGQCDYLLDLLQHMCAADEDPNALYRWVLCWLAYPLQHPGAKMKTTIVMHGPQGTGKNMFFEAIMSIYGRYGRVIDQGAIEDKFNDWASRKLFLIADEVVARSDLYHVKNKLKAFITGDWIRINPKNVAAYEERNHVNMVFLSNEPQPVVLEGDDRRHAVIWTPAKLDRAYYAACQREVDNGGVAALHDYLLNLDLGDFHSSTLPPMTRAKAELINLSMEPASRFFNQLVDGDLDGVKVMPALSQDLFDLYRAWCNRVGISNIGPLSRFINALERKHGVQVIRKRYMDGANTKGPHGIAHFKTGPQMEPGESELVWLGKYVASFRNGVKDFKQAMYG